MAANAWGRDAEWHGAAVAQEGGREGRGLSAPSLAKLESSKRLFLRWAEQNADKVMIDNGKLHLIVGPWLSLDDEPSNT